MTWETQDHDFTCSCKNAPIPMASVLHSHDGYEIYLFLSEEIRIIFENDNRIMKRGDLLLIPRMSFILQYRSVAVPTAASSSTSRNPTCRKRAPQAKKLLRMGKPPIDVCFLCGFNNYSNFSRTFSKHLKLSPKQYQISTRASFSTRNSSEQM